MLCAPRANAPAIPSPGRERPYRAVERGGAGREDSAQGLMSVEAETEYRVSVIATEHTILQRSFVAIQEDR